MKAKFGALLLALLAAGCGNADSAALTPRTFPAVPPQAPPPTATADPKLFTVSEPVNGLAARIENADPDGRDTVFVRLINVGTETLTVPAPAEGENSPFSLQAHIQGKWVDVPWSTREAGQVRWYYHRFSHPAPTLRLEKGQSALIALTGDIEDALVPANEIRMTLRVTDSPGIWHGTLRTPARPWHLSTALLKANARSQNLPTYLPFPIIGIRHSPNGSPHETIYTGNFRAYYPLLAQLSLYKDDQVREEMEKLMADATDVPHRLLPAVQAALRGSTAARDFIDNCRGSMDYETLRNVFDSLETAAVDDTQPQWATQAMMEEILNQRTVHEPQTGREVRVSEMVENDSHFSLRLGQLHCTAAVLTLIKKAQMNASGGDAITALGMIGDPQAIPALLKLLNGAPSDRRIAAGNALGKLHANAALPILLKQPETWSEPLEDLAIPSAAAALKKVKGINAQLAVIRLTHPDPTLGYIGVMEDQSLDQYDRREALFRLGYYPDPRAIPALIRAIKTDPSGAVVNNAISIIGDCYRYPESVTGLIECLDANFDRSPDWKRAYKPEMFLDHVAQVLRDITGQSLGADRAQWEAWWNSVGKKL